MRRPQISNRRKYRPRPLDRQPVQPGQEKLLGEKMTTEQKEATTMKEHELCIDATRMVNKIFEADSDWLKRMCEEEIKQREN